jgi:prepilin-type N-terminal cleavage/methylation domain-containing protein
VEHAGYLISRCLLKTRRNSHGRDAHATPFLSRTNHQSPARHRRAAFTLIELLVVIGIIVILIGILLPVVASVRRTGFVTSTSQEISRIAAACQAYYGDYHSYPGPVAENDIDGSNTPPTPPGTPGPLAPGGTTGLAYGQGPATSGQDTTPVTSSENLVLGLEGGMIVGFNNGVANGWGYQASSVQQGPQSLNPLLNSQKQTSAYLTMQPSELPPQDGSGNYLAHGPADSAIPEFLDHIPGDIVAGPNGNTGGTNASFQFGPILYFRARKGASGIVVTAANATTPQQYNFAQAAPYGFTNVSTTDYALPATNPPTGTTITYDNTTVYFANSSIAGQPRGKDSFILISAGTDRIFGTKDDIFFSN